MNKEEHKFKTWGDITEASKEFADTTCAIRLPWQLSLPIEIDGENKRVDVNLIIFDEDGKPTWAWTDPDSDGRLIWYRAV